MGVLLVALLAGFSVRLDDAVYGRPFAAWPWPDVVVGLLLAFSTAASVLGAFWLMQSRRRISELARRTSGIADAAWTVSRGGHTDSILDRIAEQACEILCVERATISVRETKDPRSAVIVAGHGVRDGIVGRRFGIDEGMLGRLFMSGEPVLLSENEGRLPESTHEGASGTKAGGAAPIRWAGEVRGALWVGTTSADREFGEQDLESLRRLADLGAVALEQADMRERLEQAVGSGVEALAEAIDMRDNYTWQHSKNVAELAVRVASRMGLDEAARAELAFAAYLHDVGKLGVPDAILLKAGSLDENEWAIMRQYPLRGAEMLERVPGLANVAQIVLCEQEHWDGSGYPQGLKGDDIPLTSRIILPCDAYDAMISNRPWRNALKPWAAVRELRAGAGHEFDPQVIVNLIGVLRESRATTELTGLRLPRVRQKA